MDITVWIKAAEQMFFSLAVAMGAPMIFASYNNFNNAIHKDAIIVAIFDAFTSILASAVIFSVLGYLSHTQGMDIENVAEAGQKLAFVTYPVALSLIPGAWAWSVAFFFMLFLVGLDSQFGTVEVLVVSITDLFPKLEKSKLRVRVHGKYKPTS